MVLQVKREGLVESALPDRWLLFLLHSNLNIDDYYFALETVETIANHIMSLYGAKITAFTNKDEMLDINLQKETEDSSVFIHTSLPGVSQVHGPENERR
jgi:glutamate dehydrogenase